MPSSFEIFVNAEIPKRIYTEVPSEGNLEPDKLLLTTGIGLGVKLIDVPNGYTTVSEYTEYKEITELISNNMIQLEHIPVSSVTVWFNGLMLINYNNSDFTVISDTITFDAGHIFTVGDILKITYKY